MTADARVLQVLSTLDRGGAESVVVEWLRRTGPDDIQMDFVVKTGERAYDFEAEVAQLGARIYRSPEFRGLNFLAYAAWWIRLLQAHPEWTIVHGHHVTPSAIYMPIARAMGRKAVAHSHTAGTGTPGLRAWFKRATWWPLRLVANYRLSCGTDAGRSMYGKRASFSVVPNGINTERFAFSEASREEVRSRLELAENTLLVGHVGSFSPPKNHSRLIEIMASVVDTKPRSHLILLGAGSLEPEIRQQVKKLGLEQFVTFAGLREDVSPFLSAMDVFLLPSKFEGLPVAIVEAQTSGLPCVVSDAVTPEAILTDLVTLVPLEEPNSVWAEAVVAAASQPIALRAARDQDVRASGYDSADVSRSIQNFYRSAFPMNQ